MARFISFRFDDGFIDGARKAAACLQPSPASFFIVTGLVSGSDRLDHIESFKGRNFGSLAEWRAMAALGPDVQPHSVTRPNFTDLSADGQRTEVQSSLAFVRGIHSGPYVFCFPYNVISDVDLASLDLSAAGFATAASDGPVAFNSLDDGTLDLFRLRSWAVRERHFDIVVDQLDRLPDQSWTILAFHSLDDEGHEPWTSEGFSRLVAIARAAGFQIFSVREMVERSCPLPKRHAPCSG